MTASHDFPLGDWGFELSPRLTAIRSSPAPATRVTTVSGDTAWLVIRYDLAKRLLSDPRLNMAAAMQAGAPRQEPWPLRFPNGTTDLIGKVRNAGIQGLLTDALAPRTLHRHQGWAEAQAAGLLRDLTRREPPADLFKELAVSLAFAVAYRHLLGEFEEQDKERLRQWWEEILSWGPVYGHSAERMRRSDQATFRFFERRLPEIVAAPGDHLIKRIAQTGALAESDVIAFAMMMLFVGVQTSVSFLAGSLVTLLRHPGWLDALRGDPGLTATTVEELLRYTPLVTGGIKRLALEDIEVDGMTIKAGELVLISLEAANRDPLAFPDPEDFNPDRDRQAHLGFGHGPHFCPGNRLARLQIEAVVRALAAHEPRLRLAVPPSGLRWRQGAAFRKPESIPVTWGPAGEPAL
ncbi:cytochrome P450 [Nonomuraea sp. NPDC002799]